MKFGDKLIKLRKAKGLSQEELAEKLNVSRQSVSKWESNNTYPETDKIVQISNIFDCSMDDLINDKVVDIEKRETTEKKKYQVVVDSFLDFIVKTVNLFTSMKFVDIIKCLFELGIIALILLLGGVVFMEILTEIMENFHIFGGNLWYYVKNFSIGIFSLIWFIVSLIIIIHVFKIRYLNYYEEYLNKNEKDNKTNSLKEPKVSIKKEKVIIRDGKDTPLAFLTILSKIVLGICKIFSILLLVGVIFVLFGLVVSLTLSLSLAIYSDLFKGLSLGLFGLIVFGIILSYLLGSFLLKKKIALKVTIISFILAFLIISFATGISILSIKDIEFKDTSSFINKNKFTQTLVYKDKMYINNKNNDTIKYIIDNTMGENITISAYHDKAFTTLQLQEENYFEMFSYSLHSIQNTRLKDIYQVFVSDLKKNIIRDYGNIKIEDLTITASSNVINKLLDNYGKVYLYEKIPIDNGYLIKTRDKKVILNNNYCLVDYDIYNDKFTVIENDCICEKNVKETSMGSMTVYSCKWDE